MYQVLPERLFESIRMAYFGMVFRSRDDLREPDLVIAQKLVSPGDVVVDVGANYGQYTKVLSDWVGPKGHVYSIEPVPYTFNILSMNVKHAALMNVELINCGISDSDRQARMELPPLSWGAANLFRSRVVSEDAHPRGTIVRVDLKALDSVLPAMVKASFIKVDVEGHELACITGATRTLRFSKAAWLIEITGCPDQVETSSHRVFQEMRSHEYEAYWFDGNLLRKQRPGESSLNYWFLLPEHLDRLQRGGTQIM